MQGQSLTKLLTGKSVSEILGIPYSTILTHAKEGVIPCVRVGRAVRFHPNAIEAFIAQGGKSLSGGWKHE